MYKECRNDTAASGTYYLFIRYIIGTLISKSIIITTEYITREKNAIKLAT